MVNDDDIAYLAKLADWCAGEGFFQIEGLEDPEEWCFRMWSMLGPENGDGYTPDALAEAVLASHRAQATAELLSWVRTVADAKWNSMTQGCDLAALLQKDARALLRKHGETRPNV